MHRYLHSKVLFLIPVESPLPQFLPVDSHAISWLHQEEADSIFLALSLHIPMVIDRLLSLLSLLRAEQAQLLQPFLAWEMSQSLKHLYHPTLDPLQELNVSLVLSSLGYTILESGEVILEYQPAFLDPSSLQDLFPWDSSKTGLKRLKFSSPETQIYYGCTRYCMVVPKNLTYFFSSRAIFASLN